MTDHEREWLRASNPVTDDALRRDPDELGRYEDIRRRLVAEVEADHLRRQQPGRLSRRWVAVVAVVGLVGACAAYLAVTARVSQPTSIGCYEEASLEATTVVVDRGAGSAIQQCEALWREGVFGTGRPVPRLEECVLPSGAVGVFPSPEGAVCSRLGRPTPASEPGAAPSESEAVELRDALVPQFLSEPCLPPARAEDLVREELKRRGMSGWTVTRPEPFTTERPCATLGMDPPGRVVLLVASPAPPR